MDDWKSLFDERGFQSRLCARFGIPKQTVNSWKNSKTIPVKYCLGVEAECGGRFTRRDFRPDDWQAIWPELVEASEAA